MKSKRDAFRDGVLKRDGRCVKCGATEHKLDAHHITDRNEMPNGGYVLSNGIALCDRPGGCHMKAEKFHMSGNKEWIDGFHPDDLYSAIGSSYEEAYKDSEGIQ
jgi:hypothetical protein